MAFRPTKGCPYWEIGLTLGLPRSDGSLPNNQVRGIGLVGVMSTALGHKMYTAGLCRPNPRYYETQHVTKYGPIEMANTFCFKYGPAENALGISLLKRRTSNDEQLLVNTTLKKYVVFRTVTF
jgi:hypothetical protein